MQIKELEKLGLKQTFQVNISASILDDIKNKKIKKIAETAKIQGFRVGKAPANIVESQNKSSILSYVLQEATDKAISKVYDDHKLFTVGSPAVEIKDFDLEKGMELTVAFDLFPEIKDIDLSKIKIDKNVVEITDVQINSSLEQIAGYYKSFKDVEEDREAKSGDVAVINFLGSVDGVEFEGGKGENFPLELGSNMFIPGFEEQLVGKKVGDKVIVNAKFPDDYYAEHLKGKDSKFEVDIVKLQVVNKDIDDELAKKSGFETLDLLKEDIRKKYTTHIENLERHSLKSDLMKALVQVEEFDIPENLVKKEQDLMWDSFVKMREHMKSHEAKGDHAEHGHTLDEVAMYNRDENEVKAEQAITAKEKVKLALVLNYISNKNKIKIDNEDVEAFIQREAVNHGANVKDIMKYYKSDKSSLRQLESRVMEDKIVDFILSQVSYKENKISFEDYTKKYNQQ